MTCDVDLAKEPPPFTTVATCDSSSSSRSSILSCGLMKKKVLSSFFSASFSSFAFEFELAPMTEPKSGRFVEIKSYKSSVEVGRRLARVLLGSRVFDLTGRGGNCLAEGVLG